MSPYTATPPHPSRRLQQNQQTLQKPRESPEINQALWEGVINPTSDHIIIKHKGEQIEIQETHILENEKNNTRNNKNNNNNNNINSDNNNESPQELEIQHQIKIEKDDDIIEMIATEQQKVEPPIAKVEAFGSMLVTQDEVSDNDISYDPSENENENENENEDADEEEEEEEEEDEEDEDEEDEEEEMEEEDEEDEVEEEEDETRVGGGGVVLNHKASDSNDNYGSDLQLNPTSDDNKNENKLNLNAMEQYDDKTMIPNLNNLHPTPLFSVNSASLGLCCVFWFLRFLCVFFCAFVCVCVYYFFLFVFLLSV